MQHWKVVIGLCWIVSTFSAAYGQVSFDFENVSGSNGGIVLSGQGGWYNPIPASSDHFLVYTYLHNNLNIGSNAFGCTNFVGGVKLNSGFFVRAQRDVNFENLPDVIVIAFDQYIGYVFTDRNNNDNVGSVSSQSAFQKQFILLTMWAKPRTFEGSGDGRPEDGWDSAFALFDPAGTSGIWRYRDTDLDGDGEIDPAPFNGLAINKWYRRYAVIDFANNRLIKHAVKDLATGSMWAHHVGTGDEWDNLHGQFVYVSGGANSTQPKPSAIRLFTGGGAGESNGNLTAFDNLAIYPYFEGDVNMDGCVNLQDFTLAQSRFGAGTGDPRTTFEPGDVDGSGYVDDFDLILIALQAGSGCPGIPPCSPANRPPIAVNDTYSTNLNTQLSVNAPGVLGNDNDPDGGALTAVFVSGPTHGNLNLNPDGSFTYTPGANRCDAATFTYRARDPEGNLSNEATVTISINPTDLTVTAMGMPGSDGTRVSATVRNSGTGTVLPGVPVKFYVGDPNAGGVLIGSAQTATPLAGGQSEEVILTLPGVPFTSGNLITAVIDPDNTLCETNENNNRMMNEMVYTTEPYDLWAWTLPAPYLHPTGTLVGINTQTGKYRIFGIGLLDPSTGQPLDAEFHGIGMRGEDRVLFFMVTKRTGGGLSNNYTVYSVPSDNIQLNAQSYVSNLTQVREFARMSQSPATRSTTNSLCLGADDALYFVQFDEATGADRGLYRYRPGQGFIRKVVSFAQGEGQFLGDIAFDPCNSPDGEGGGDLIGWGITPNGEKRLFRIPSVLVYDADPTPRETIWRDYFPDWNSFSSPSGAGEVNGFTFDLFTLTPYLTHETGNGAYHYQRHQPDLRQLIPHTFTPFGRDLASEPEVRPFCPDTNRDSIVNDLDLLNILFDFGGPPSGFRGRTDLNCDGVVDDIDLLNVLFRFGDIC